MSSPQGRVAELDGLRGLAILSVLIWHWVHLPAQPPVHTIWSRLNVPLRISWSGVDLFFVLSGYLIGLILLSKRQARNYYSVFYARRALRILPVYYAVLAAYLVASHVGSLASLMAIKMPAWWYFTQMQNVGMAFAGGFPGNGLSITWSLAIEEQFYLMLPVLIRVVPIERLPVLLLSLIAAGTALRLAIFSVSPQSAGFLCYVLLPCRWDPLLIGVVIAWARHQKRDVSRIAYGALPALLTLLWLGISAKGVIMSGFVTRYGYTLLGVCYGILLLAVLTNNRWRSVMRFRPLVYLGTISYGVYLLHETINPLIFLALRHSPPHLANWIDAATVLVSFAVTLGAASLSWKFFESKSVRLGHSFIYAEPWQKS